jgi:formylglycine-generating enzyme required for sulfatase activity
MHILISAPEHRDQIPAWRDQLHQWRGVTRALMQYDGTLYSAPEFAWVPRTFTLGLVMMCDVLFYEGDYQLDAFLEHGQREFGGYDAIILWHAYPRIGFDNRNQFDFYRQMPGGLLRLRALVDACHAKGIKVYIDYNPWDTGTRREDKADIDALVDLVVALDADAIFLDTMSNAAVGLREKLDATRAGVALESEVAVPLDFIETHPSSWAQGFTDVPGVLRNKWFERRHMQHRIRRWQHDHTPELHTAWMNGCGIVVWENVFGTLILWNERDKSILRSMIGVQRRYADLFCGEEWTPLVTTLDERISASHWKGGDNRLWTLVNATEDTLSGDVLRVPHDDGCQYYDLIGGTAIEARIVGDEAIIPLKFAARGAGAVLVTTHSNNDLNAFLMSQAEIHARANFDPTPPRVTQELVEPPRQPGNAEKHPTIENRDMAYFAAHQFDMTATFTVRECGFYDVPGVTPPSLRFVNLHKDWSVTRPVSIAPFAIDKTPVTNRQFAAFLSATNYEPDCKDNFLAHWNDGAIPAGQEDHPVVWVDLTDARAYAAWAGKRLPTEAEWQHAAQGVEGRRWPWGNDWNVNACNYGQFGSTTPVKQFQQGATPDGVYDLCGNVWEWTESEYTDGRTRFAILKGGSYYKAHGSVWYADGGAKPNDFAAKFLLMYPGLDHCATVGFRCAASVETS